MSPRTLSAEWEERTVREVWNVPASAVRRCARVVLGGLGSLVIIAAVLRWLSP